MTFPYLYISHHLIKIMICINPLSLKKYTFTLFFIIICINVKLILMAKRSLHLLNVILYLIKSRVFFRSLHFSWRLNEGNLVSSLPIFTINVIKSNAVFIFFTLLFFFNSTKRLNNVVFILDIGLLSGNTLAKLGSGLSLLFFFNYSCD